MIERIHFGNIKDFIKKLEILENKGYIWAGSKQKPLRHKSHYMVYKENTVLEIFHDVKQIGFCDFNLKE